MDFATLTGFKTNSGARRDIEPHPTRLRAVEDQRRIGFVEMIMAAYLNGTVARIRDRKGHARETSVELNGTAGRQDFPGNHGTVTALAHGPSPISYRPETSLRSAHRGSSRLRL